jgi:hypothetical protein
MISSRNYGSGFVKARVRVFVSETPESPIPDFPKRGISQHVTSLNRRSTIAPGFPPRKVTIPCLQDSRSRDSRFPEMGDLATRGLRQLDNSDLSWGFHHGKSRTLVNRNLDSAIPDFPKWEISRHVASVNRTTQIYPRVSTMESLDPLGC